MSEDKYFRLFSSSKVVRGKDLGAIYLLNRERIEKIPLSVCDLINKLSKYSVEDVKQKYKDEKIINQWINYLWKNNIGHFTKDPDFFVDSSNDYFVPSIIRRCQIEFSNNSPYDINSVVSGLELLLCKHIEIRILGEIDISEIKYVLNSFRNSCIRSIDLYIESNKFISRDEIISIVKNNPKVYVCNVFGSKILESHNNINFINKDLSFFIKRKWNLNNFIINTEFYTKSLTDNTFYSQKIAIDQKGFIKNDLSLDEIFGNIQNTDISKITDNLDFTNFWNINNDFIEELKYSELRYAIYPARKIIKTNDKYHIEL